VDERRDAAMNEAEGDSAKNGDADMDVIAIPTL
jgi:hypothetical protein